MAVLVKIDEIMKLICFAYGVFLFLGSIFRLVVERKQKDAFKIYGLLAGIGVMMSIISQMA